MPNIMSNARLKKRVYVVKTVYDYDDVHLSIEFIGREM